MLSFVEKGSGSPLVLLHAFPLSSRMWDQQIEEWSQGFRVIAPDWRGFGRSPMGDKEITMEQCADDLHELLSQLRLPPVALLGLSMGGYVAFEFARKYSRHLQALILAATQPVADSEQGRTARFETADFVLNRGTTALADRLIPRLLGKTTLAAKPEVVQKVRALIEGNGAAGVAQACYGLAARRDSTPFLSEITVPTLLLQGAEDVIVPHSQGHLMHERVSSSQLATVDQSGHLLNLEQPSVFSRLVLEFLHSTGS
ncbi:MAG: alpha/beta hydrolase [Acidobacteriota bacterium]